VPVDDPHRLLAGEMNKDVMLCFSMTAIASSAKSCVIVLGLRS
jgi:hypothetical protein